MTTKVLVVNHGPDALLVRTVQYANADLDLIAEYGDKGHKVIEDMIVGPTESKVFWVHTHQQLLVGEKRVPTAAEGSARKPQGKEP